MILALLGVVVILTSPWIFLYFSPKTQHERRLLAFNTLVLLGTFLLCICLTLWVRSIMLGGPDSEWWPIVALTYAGLLTPVLLLIGGLIRNFLMF